MLGFFSINTLHNTGLFLSKFLFLIRFLHCYWTWSWSLHGTKSWLLPLQRRDRTSHYTPPLSCPFHSAQEGHHLTFIHAGFHQPCYCHLLYLLLRVPYFSASLHTLFSRAFMTTLNRADSWRALLGTFLPWESQGEHLLLLSTPHISMNYLYI